MRLATRPLATLFLSTTIAALPLHAAPPGTPEDQAVLAPIQALFDGMARRDAAAIQLPLLPGGAPVPHRGHLAH